MLLWSGPGQAGEEQRRWRLGSDLGYGLYLDDSGALGVEEIMALKAESFMPLHGVMALGYTRAPPGYASSHRRSHLVSAVGGWRWHRVISIRSISTRTTGRNGVYSARVIGDHLPSEPLCIDISFSRSARMARGRFFCVYRAPVRWWVF